MCDTLVATSLAARDGATLLAKNSDREPNEAQVVEWAPAADYAPDTMLAVTHMTIPQAAHTHAVLLCRPFWMWGCEMGVNEHGLAIGNEAVFTREPYADKGLLGMDMMRLALERCDNAESAVDLITRLLAEYGQGGSAGYLHTGMRYHNSFLVADATGAWVLETAGEHWAAARVKGVRSISNGLTLSSAFDRASPELVSHAVDRRWCKNAASFDMARCYSDLVYTRGSMCHTRQSATQAAAGSGKGTLDAAAMMRILQQHEPGADQGTWAPARSSMGSICMHAGNELLRSSQTTGSLVAELRPGEPPIVWVTATSAPCLSLFKPILLHPDAIPDWGPVPGARLDSETLWWQHERLHRAVLDDYAALHRLIEQEQRELQTRFDERVSSARAAGTSPAAWREVSQRCWQEAADTEARWTELVEKRRRPSRRQWLYRGYWRKQNRLAGIG